MMLKLDRNSPFSLINKAFSSAELLLTGCFTVLLKFPEAQQLQKFSENQPVWHLQSHATVKMVKITFLLNSYYLNITHNCCCVSAWFYLLHCCYISWCKGGVESNPWQYTVYTLYALMYNSVILVDLVHGPLDSRVGLVPYSQYVRYLRYFLILHHDWYFYKSPRNVLNIPRSSWCCLYACMVWHPLGLFISSSGMGKIITQDTVNVTIEFWEKNEERGFEIHMF